MIRGFRIWDIEKKEYAELVSATFSLSGELLSITKKNGHAPVLADNYIVEQYTGLKDKSGKEIYEGDIVKYKLYADSRLDYIDEVFYSTISGAFMIGDEDNIRTLDCLINVEVIGNVHENKELLGGKK